MIGATASIVALANGKIIKNFRLQRKLHRFSTIASRGKSISVGRVNGAYDEAKKKKKRTRIAKRGEREKEKKNRVALTLKHRPHIHVDVATRAGRS